MAAGDAAMKATKVMKAMKAMKAMFVIEHFDRSDMADGAALHLRPKLDALRTLGMKCVTSLLCQAISHWMCYQFLKWVLDSIGAYGTASSCVLIMGLMHIGTSYAARHGCHKSFPCEMPKVSPISSVKRDLCGGGSGSAASMDTQPDIGSKAWIDMILGGLHARRLTPPVAQIRMLVADATVHKRLQDAEALKQQLDILCGAAFKAKLGWQKADATDPPKHPDAVGTSPVVPPIHAWRLRTRDWRTCKPASGSDNAQLLSGERADVFRAKPDGDPLSQMWLRKLGAYFVSDDDASRVIKSLPAHSPPAGLFSLITLKPTPRSEATPVRTLVLHPDDSPHLLLVYVTNLGTEKLTHAEWTNVSLAPVQTVEVLLEWWKDLSTDAVLASYKSIEAAANKPSPIPLKGKSAGKGKPQASRTRLPDSLVATVNSQMSCMLGDASGQRLGNTWKTTGHNIKPDIIRVSVRVPKEQAVTWLREGSGHTAVIVRDISEFPEVADLCKVWVAHGSVLMEGSPLHTRQALALCMADFGQAWSVVRTPFRWGVRVPKDKEKQVKALLQPHAVHVAEGHYRFRIANIPQSLDPEVLVATLATGDFKPYLVSAGRGSVVIAAPTAPPDIVFHIQDINVTLMLQSLPSVSSGSAKVGTTRPDDCSPKRKARKPENPEGIPPVDVKGGKPSVVASHNRFQLLDEDFPELPSAAIQGAADPGRDVGLHDDGKPPALPNLGNTCYAAVALQCIRHITSRSAGFAVNDVRLPSLRAFLQSPGPASWRAFVHDAGLGGAGAEPEDAALYLESILEQEPQLAARVRIAEETQVECVGCGECRPLSQDLLIHRIVAPSTPTDLQTLLREEAGRLEPEIEVQCAQCFAETAVPVGKHRTPSDWLVVQVRRGGRDSVKNSTAVYADSIESYGKCWELCMVICHLGQSAADGHYVALERDPGDAEVWRLIDEAENRTASDRDRRLAHECGTIYLFRECLSDASSCPAPEPTPPAEVSQPPDQGLHEQEVTTSSLDSTLGEPLPNAATPSLHPAKVSSDLSLPAVPLSCSECAPIPSTPVRPGCTCPGLALTNQLADQLVAVCERLTELEQRCAHISPDRPETAEVATQHGHDDLAEFVCRNCPNTAALSDARVSM